MGFWDFLFKSSYDAPGNYVDFPDVRNTVDATNTPDYSEEYASELHAGDYDVRNFDADGDRSYSRNGVSFRTGPDCYRLAYDGILARDGAQDVYAVVGLDDDGVWKDIRYYPMYKVGGHSFEVLVPAERDMKMNVAFKDGADHWDNNSGENYSYVKEGG